MKRFLLTAVFVLSLTACATPPPSDGSAPPPPALHTLDALSDGLTLAQGGLDAVCGYPVAHPKFCDDGTMLETIHAGVVAAQDAIAAARAAVLAKGGDPAARQALIGAAIRAVADFTQLALRLKTGGAP